MQFSAETGTAAVHGSTAYFSYNHEIYSYTVFDSKWTELPPCKYQHFGMAVVSGRLTTIGGRKDILNETNILLSLLPGHSSWQEVLPPMPTGRVRPAVVATDTHLVVAGGTDTDVVEVLERGTLQWFTAANAIPKSNYSPYMALCSGKIYLRQDGIFSSCSLQEVIQPHKPTSANSEGDSVWKNIAAVSEYDTTIVTFGEHVLAIGGRRYLSATTTATAICCYDNSTDSWNVIEHLPTPQHSVVTAVLPSNEVIVVGGKNNKGTRTNNVYIGSC